ncbi:unnamed protein product [Cuscuta campestris]|uniref:S-protein homolog n=1 Tax=Cuscuta campestris TaxID=132261 RepID=A0A484LTU6_9ASTE|nr:unnamed protein product [Cuscuta campestris]
MASQLETSSAIYVFRKVVRIKSWMPGPYPLLAHCRSKSDDLGEWTMAWNAEQDISFKTNLYGTTLFWCDFKWATDTQTKSQSVPVFNDQDPNNPCNGDKDEKYCNWIVKPDGFYRAAGNQTRFPDDYTFITPWK